MAAGSPILAFLPEPTRAFTYGKTDVDVFAPNEVLRQVAGPITRPAGVTTATGVTVCRSQTSGNFWACYDADDDPYLGSFLVEYNATSGVLVRKAKLIRQTLVPSAEWGPVFPKLAELGGAHALFDVGCDTFISVNRRTADVIRFKLIPGATSADFWKGIFDKKFSLNIAPLDAWPNADGTRLSYIDGSHIRIWDLELDRFFRTVV